MYSKTEVLNKLDEFVNYSIQQSPQYQNQYKSIIEPLKESVSRYFSNARTEFKTPLNDLQLSFYSDVLKRKTKYEKMNCNLPSNFPASYSDLRKLFYNFPIMGVSNSTFYNAWVSKADETTGEATITNNTLVDKYVVEINEYITKELANIQSLYKWLEQASGSAGLTMLWEDMGNIIESPNPDEIMNQLFIQSGFLEAIQKLNLPTYIPTKYKG